MRSDSGPYASRSAFNVTTTRPQYGHWKSEKTTIVTSASRLPSIGSLLDTGTGESASLHTSFVGTATGVSSMGGAGAAGAFDAIGTVTTGAPEFEGAPPHAATITASAARLIHARARARVCE